MSIAAMFLDKGGRLDENVPYNADPARVRLTPADGNDAEWVRSPARVPDSVASDFAEAEAHVAAGRGRHDARAFAEHAR